MNRVTTIVSDTAGGKTMHCLGGAVMWALLTKKPVLYLTFDMSEAGIAGRLNRAGLPLPENFVVKAAIPMSLRSQDIVHFIQQSHLQYDLVVIDQVDLLADFVDQVSQERLDMLKFGDQITAVTNGAAVWMTVPRSRGARLAPANQVVEVPTCQA